MKQSYTLSILAVALCIVTTAISSYTSQAQSRHQRADIVDTAVAAGSFNTLAAALKQADLVNTLKKDGPFTVFAPTDEAFNQLPKGTVEDLLKPENKQKLIDILTYHVASGRLRAEEVAERRTVETLNGQRVAVAIDDGGIGLNNASVISADIRASNGIIHVIDQVLIPETRTIPEVADAASSFNTLLTAVTEADLAEVLASEGPFTVLAPTDEAFGQLPRGTVASLLEPENRESLQQILKYHVIQGRLYSDDFFRNRSVRTLAGTRVKLSFTDGAFKVNATEVVAPDVAASNGVIHVINQVLMPGTMTSADAAAADVMKLAIDKGVPLFNHGQKSACASIYEVAARAVVAMEGVSEDVRKPLRESLRRIETTHSASRRAWMLREGMDQSLATLEANVFMASR